jgi:hypothetical protein
VARGQRARGEGWRPRKGIWNSYARILKGETSVPAAARKHGLTVAEVEEWRERFLFGAENALRARPKDEEALKDEQIKKLALPGFGWPPACADLLSRRAMVPSLRAAALGEDATWTTRACTRRSWA